MKTSDFFTAGRKPFPSLEIVPPLQGMTRDKLMGSVRPLMEFNPPYINVTRHRDEVVFTGNPDGSYERRTIRRRVSETAVCTALQAEFKVEVVPHVICGGETVDTTSSLLQDLRFLGIENVMALRGDSLVGEKRFTAERNGYRYASELVAGIREFDKAEGTDFCIGVGAYPEKHFEAANLAQDIANLKKKVDAGANYIITQMFFDNEVFYKFRDRCVQAGIDVPIIPGLKPLSSPRQIELLPESFSIDIPQELCLEMQAHASNKDACYEIGRDWCSEQCKDLLKHGVPAVHFYTMGRQDNVISILRSCF